MQDTHALLMSKLGLALPLGTFSSKASLDVVNVNIDIDTTADEVKAIVIRLVVDGVNHVNDKGEENGRGGVDCELEPLTLRFAGSLRTSNAVRTWGGNQAVGNGRGLAKRHTSLKRACAASISVSSAPGGSLSSYDNQMVSPCSTLTVHTRMSL